MRAIDITNFLIHTKFSIELVLFMIASKLKDRAGGDEYLSISNGGNMFMLVHMCDIEIPLIRFDSKDFKPIESE